MRTLVLILLLCGLSSALKTSDLFSDPRLVAVISKVFNSSRVMQERLKIDALLQEVTTYARSVDVDIVAIQAMRQRGDTAAARAREVAWLSEYWNQEILLKSKVPITVNLSEEGYFSLTADELRVARECGLFKIVAPKMQEE